ncbi:UNVERIFIED_CONTAM: hypothetical protein GTU68_017966 [Idotea baltica]|nr:hypothetical protein [Idotea baltica]
MNIPAELKYTKEHEWIRVDQSTLSITDFAQGELGDLVYVEVDTVGEHLEKDAIFGTVEAVKTTSDLFLPVAGTILEFNSALSEEDGDDPSLINSDPYGEGWIVRIEISVDDVEELLSASAYEELIGG